MSHHLGRIALIALVVALLGGAVAADEPSARGEASARAQHVTYGGLAIDIPSAWTVVDLAANPGTCVRFDAHVLYLGTPGAIQDCPAVILGRTEAILLQPTPSDIPASTVTVAPGSIADPTPGQILAGEVVAQISALPSS